MQLISFSIDSIVDNVTVQLFPTLIKRNGEFFLIDCGYEESVEPLTTRLRELGVPDGQLNAVLLSHDDHDHLGGLHLLKQLNPTMKIYCGALEKDAVEGLVPSERLLQAEASLAALAPEHQPWAMEFIARLKRIVRLPVDAVLNAGDFFQDELLVLHTPGHTKGHLSFYYAPEKTLIASDALIAVDDGFDIANPAFTLDLPEALQSVKKIQQLEPEKIICYHGGTVQYHIREKLDKLFERYRSFI